MKSDRIEKARATDGRSVSEDGKPELGETAGEVETLEAEAATPITLGRATTSTLSAGSSEC